MTQIGADGEKGSARVPRAISGVSPETLFGETPNTTREDAYAPQTLINRTLLAPRLQALDLQSASICSICGLSNPHRFEAWLR
jgi:hypothetical protein